MRPTSATRAANSPTSTPAATACRNSSRRTAAIENEDIVVWHTFGSTHVCRPEDFPVMPVEYAGFMLKPSGFFAENPAMDLPPDRNNASRDNRGAGACCA